MANDQFLDYPGLRHFWNKLKDFFVAKDGNKVLSDNNYTDEDKEKVAGLNNYALTPATSETLGGIKVGSGLEIESDGRLSASDRKFLLEIDQIPDTTASITFAANGNVDKIAHVGDNGTIRTDVFVFSDNAITETRTLNTGEKLTIRTNTNTLLTTTTYSEA